jgi:hypothetical protein
MLKDVINKIDSAIPSLFPVDPTQFHDPVATQTGWKQVRSAKVARASNKLIQTDPDQLVYKPSIGGRIMGVILALAGAFAIFLYTQIKAGSGGITFESGSGDPIFIALFGLALIVVGVVIFMFATSPVVFDKRLGMFYRGRKQRNQPDAANSKNALRFSDIHAVQLLSRLESSKSNDRALPRFYKVHDLNLVKHDGERLYITTYSKVNRAREDAAKIGAFVQVPVWDGSDDGPIVPF